MTTVPPPSTPQPQVTAAPSQPAVVQILNPPPAIVALPPGTALETVVKPQPQTNTPPADGAKLQTITLTTPQGEVTIKLPIQLPGNAKVALEVLRAAQANQQTPQVTVRLVSIDNQPAVQVLAQLARQAAADPRLAQQPPPTSLLQIPANDPQNPLLRATLLPAGNAWTANGPIPLPSVGTVSALVVLGNPAAATPEQMLTALSTPQNTSPIPTTNAASAGAQPNPPPSAATLTPPMTFVTGSEVSLRVTNITLPGAQPVMAPPVLSNSAIPSIASPMAGSPPALGGPTTPPTPAGPFSQIVAAPPTTGPIITNAQGLPPAPPAPPQTVQASPILATLNGTVVSQTPTGMPVVDTGAGQIQLNIRTNLPVGTQVTFEVSALLEPRSGLLPLPSLPAAALPLSGPPGAMAGWPTLTEAIQTLQRLDPATAQTLAQAIPDGGPKTAAAMISFAQAMRTGDTRQWPGDSALRALERAGPRGAHLASQLSEEVGALSARARDTGAEWRALPLPWNAEGHIDRIALITRREGDADNDVKKKSGGGGQRFLINLDLSRLGEMQLDGMFRKESRGFDLMVRTKTELSEQIRNDLLGIFTASNAAMGLKGGLTFQVVKKFSDPTAGVLNADKGGLWA